MEIIKTRLEMSEAECPRCGTTLRYWPAEKKTEVLDRYVSRYPLRVPLYDYIIFAMPQLRVQLKFLVALRAIYGKRKTACGMRWRKVDE